MNLSIHLALTLSYLMGHSIYFNVIEPTLSSLFVFQDIKTDMRPEYSEDSSDPTKNLSLSAKLFLFFFFCFLQIQKILLILDIGHRFNIG